MIKMRLQTFIKLCHMDQVELVGALDKMLSGTGSGHNFHWSLRKAIHRHIEGALPDEIDDILNSPTKDAEKKYNRQAFEAFIFRFAKVSQIEALSETHIYPIPKFGLELKVEPWFKTMENGQSHVHLV